MHSDDVISTIISNMPDDQESWELSGFINKNNEIYTFGTDSKIIGRLFEIIVFEVLEKSAKQLGYELKEAEKQTIYPDFYFLKPDGRKIAIDIKTTYRKPNNPNFSFTGGSFTSYMRGDGSKNIEGNYSEYDAHYILGVVYAREENPTKGKILINNLKNIVPCYKDVEFFVQEKFKICGERKGSGNTDNIGTINADITYFREGRGPFSILGKDIFEDYWKNYPKYKDSKEIKDSLYTTIDGYIRWVRESQGNLEKAKSLEAKYAEYKKSLLEV